MEQLLIYFAIGGCTGWLLAWALGRGAPRTLKFIIFGGLGGLGGLAGGYLIHFIKDLAPMAGSALGALVLLAFIKKK